MRVSHQSPGCRGGNCVRSPRETHSRDSCPTLIVLLCLSCLLVLFVSSPAGAAIPSLTWEPPEAVDSPVPDVSSSSGCSVQHNPGRHPVQWPDEWYVVYVHDGDVYYCVRGTSGWGPPEQLNTTPGREVAAVTVSGPTLLPGRTAAMAGPKSAFGRARTPDRGRQKPG
jgi:hypothetical protein